MPNHDLESLQARTSRGAFFTPAPKQGAIGRKKGGRPSTYTEAKGVEVCTRIVEGQSLRTVCRAPGMPGLTTLFEWRRAHPGFAEQYAHAREDQADAHIEEMLDVARSAPRAKSSEEVQGYRLLVDTLKWRAGKMKPKSYGDKLTLDGGLSVRQMTDEQLNARLAYLLGHRPGAVQGDPLAQTCHATKTSCGAPPSLQHARPARRQAAGTEHSGSCAAGYSPTALGRRMGAQAG
jgi:hypothetical protein